MSVFLVPLLFLALGLGSFWWMSHQRPAAPSFSSPTVTEAQVFDGRLNLPEGSVLASGARFLVASVKGKTLSCLEAAGLRRIDDVEMRLRPCRFQILETGIKVEGGGLQVWVYKKGTRFDAETSAATFGVLGTRFDLEVLPDQTARLRVLEGEVQVKARQSDAVQNVAAGSGLQVTAAGVFSPLPVSVPPGPEKELQEGPAPGNTASAPDPATTPAPDPRPRPAPAPTPAPTPSAPDSPPAPTSPTIPAAPDPGRTSTSSSAAPGQPLDPTTVPTPGAKAAPNAPHAVDGGTAEEIPSEGGTGMDELLGGR